VGILSKERMELTQEFLPIGGGRSLVYHRAVFHKSFVDTGQTGVMFSMI
jgi:hypothetical protein